MKSSAFGSDDDVERAVRRLSATVRSQRKQMTDSLGELEREVNALTDMSPNRAAASGELAALKFELVQAKQREATAIEASPSGGAQVQRLKLELNLANEEVQKRGAQIRSMELKLRGQDEQSKRLIALEEQLERQRRAHEKQLATHRQAEQDLAARLERRRPTRGAPPAPPPRCVGRHAPRRSGRPLRRVRGDGADGRAQRVARQPGRQRGRFLLRRLRP